MDIALYVDVTMLQKQLVFLVNVLWENGKLKMKNKLNIEKVRIEELMELLSFVKAQGFDFVDLIGIPGEEEQSLGVITQPYYKHEEEINIPETDIKLSEINLNDLI